MIQKVQNVIKIISFILLGFYCLPTNAQVNNYYSGHYSNGNSTLTLFKNGSFSYKEGGDLGDSDYGQGIYFFKNKKLILNYNKTKLGNLSSYSNYKIWQNNKNSIELIITVLDFNKKPIIGANIYCSEYKQIIQTNKKGIGILNLPKKIKDSEINVAFLGFKKSRVLINLRFNYKITVFLSEGDLEGVPILNQTDTLKVVSFKASYFKVKNKNGKIITWKKYKP